MAKRGPKPKKTEYYIDPAVFKQQLVEYYKDSATNESLIAESINKIANGLSYSSNFINYCVDENTLALTKRGWLTYKDITVSDTILSYDSGTLKWSPISEIFINPDYNGKMFKLTTKGLDALVTPGHKFITVENGLKSIEHITTQEHIVLMGSHEQNTYTQSKYFVEIVGWAVTEGYYKIQKRTNAIVIAQKKGPKADRIREALISLNAKFKEYIHRIFNNKIENFTKINKKRKNFN